MKTFKDIDQRLSDEIISFIYNGKSGGSKLNMSFYGYFFTRINFKEVSNKSTACVYAKGSRLYLEYNKAFTDVLSKEEIRFLLMHELSHLLFSHLNRIGDRNPKKANVVADMIINSSILEDFDNTFKQIEGSYTCTNDAELDIPKLLVPPEYKGRRIFEELYDWLQEQTDKDKSESGEGEENQGNSQGEGQGNGQSESEGQGNGQGEGQDQEGKNPSNNKGGKKPSNKKGKSSKGEDSEELATGKRLFKDIENGKDVQCTDDHRELSETEKQIMDSITKDIVEGLKNRGLVSSDVEKFLDKLSSNRKNNLKWILQNLSFVMGSKVAQTWTKPNRYEIKGKKGEKMEGHQLNVILDVSGSMYGLHEKVLSTVYMNGLQCNIILADTTVKDFIVTKSKSDLQKIKLTGFGGTELQPAIDYIKNNKDIRDINTLVLTDGYCDSLDFNGLRGRKMIITTDVEVKATGANLKQKKLTV
jgi:predicted metal-dependent peptidase